MILYQRCRSECSLSLSTHHLSFSLFLHYSHSNSPSLPPCLPPFLCSPPFLSSPPPPQSALVGSHSPFPPPSLSRSQSWIWRMHRAEAGLALKKRRAWNGRFSFLFFLPPPPTPLPPTWSFRRGSRMCVSSQLQRPSPPMLWAEVLLGALELFKNT